MTQATDKDAAIFEQQPPLRRLHDCERERYLTRRDQGVLATVSPTGSPHLSPVIYRWDAEQRVIRVSTRAGRVKATNLAADNHAALYVEGPDRWSFVVAEARGEVSPVTTEPGDATGLELLDVFPQPGPEAAANFLATQVAEQRVVLAAARHPALRRHHRAGRRRRSHSPRQHPGRLIDHQPTDIQAVDRDTAARPTPRRLRTRPVAMTGRAYRIPRRGRSVRSDRRRQQPSSPCRRATRATPRAGSAIRCHTGAGHTRPRLLTPARPKRRFDDAPSGLPAWALPASRGEPAGDP